MEMGERAEKHIAAAGTLASERAVKPAREASGALTEAEGAPQERSSVDGGGGRPGALVSLGALGEAVGEAAAAEVRRSGSRSLGATAMRAAVVEAVAAAVVGAPGAEGAGAAPEERALASYSSAPRLSLKAI